MLLITLIHLITIIQLILLLPRILPLMIKMKMMNIIMILIIIIIKQMILVEHGLFSTVLSGWINRYVSVTMCVICNTALEVSQCERAWDFTVMPSISDGDH